MEFTLFEVHFPDAEFNAPFAGREAATREGPLTDAVGEGGPSVPLGPVAAVLAIVGMGLLVRYLRGGEAEQTTLDEVAA